MTRRMKATNTVNDAVQFVQRALHTVKSRTVIRQLVSDIPFIESITEKYQGEENAALGKGQAEDKGRKL